MEQVLAGVPRDARCRCREDAAAARADKAAAKADAGPAPGGFRGFIDKLLGR